MYEAGEYPPPAQAMHTAQGDGVGAACSPIRIRMATAEKATNRILNCSDASRLNMACSFVTPIHCRISLRAVSSIQMKHVRDHP
jgi:hypothetical protein